MSNILGIDTSNYTTSLALLNTEDMKVIQQKMLLPVKKGEKGIRQSDAVFYHTKQLPQLMEKMFEQLKEKPSINAVGASYAPRLAKGSYMPCFLAGDGLASSLSALLRIPLERTSHQMGHILSGIYSCEKFDMLKEGKAFFAFHASGGTTDLLLCRPDKDNVLSIAEIGSSLDLKAGQAVDRVGVMLGMTFPCGKELDKAACKSNKEYKIKSVIKNCSCCLSGLENLCRKMYDNNQSYEDIANYCISFLAETFSGMIAAAIKKYGEMPVLCVGGVMSNTMIKEKLSDQFGAFFAKPELSCDNAVGTAVYCALKRGMI